jgi:hypothetical protein
VADDLARRYPQIRVLHLPHCGRIGLVREAGRLAASGEYIQYLDSDDVLAPEKFSRMVAALVERPDCDIAYCYTRRYTRGCAPFDVPTELTGCTFDRLLPVYAGARIWHTSTPLYRRRICDKAGPWSDLQFWEDIEYDIRIGTYSPHLAHCREYLTDFRDHDFPRACDDDAESDGRQLPRAARAAACIYDHLSTYGLTASEPAMRLFLDDVRVLRQRSRERKFDAAVEVCASILGRAYGGRDLDADEPVRLHVAVDALVDRMTAAPGQMAHLPVCVINRSTIALRSGEFAAELTSRLRTPDGRLFSSEHPTVLFREPVFPGAQRIVHLPVPAPEATGEYCVDVDLLWGNTVWLKETGAALPTVPLDVGPALRDANWWLQAEGGNLATTQYLPDCADAVRVEVQRSTTTEPWHIQLNQGGFSIAAGVHYILELRARADRPRRLFVAVGRADRGLGLYTPVELSPDWQDLTFEFEANGDALNARVHIDAGGSDVPFDVMRCRLRRAPTRTHVSAGLVQQ